MNIDHHLDGLVGVVNALSSNVNHEGQEGLGQNLENLRRSELLGAACRDHGQRFLDEMDGSLLLNAKV